MRAKALEKSGGDASPEALLRAVAEITGIPSQGLPAGHNLLFGAKATIDSCMVWFDQEVEKWEQYFNRLHEYAHYWQHGESFICCQSDIDAGASEDAITLGARRVDGYGPHERRELEANVFAREFLLPGDELKKRFLSGENAVRIADAAEMTEGMVIHGLTRALLGIEIEKTLEPEKENPVQIIELDEDQKRAARAGEDEFAKGLPGRTILVDAGPGTGKTQTLIERVSRLLNVRKVSPNKILAVTFSNKAAEEVYVRVRTLASKEVSQIWMGTFHKFGLDLIRKYHAKVGVAPTPTVIDTVDAQLLLEQNLARLELKHYRSLQKPTLYLKDILSAISRAKDELIEPAKYAECAADDRRNAKTEDEVKRAEKSIEVARVYSVYQELLKENDFLDYDDLLFRSVKLLAEHEDVCEKEQKQYEHILVDEYQDVNTATRYLLKFLAGDGAGLWIVGDLRQAIYRFRGASPINMRLLTTKDFPNAETIRLNTNYRSQQAVVDIFTRCANGMNTASAKEKWEVERKDNDADIRYRVSANERTEAAELIEEIKRLEEAGVEYRDQAVLCRRHDDLMRLSEALEKAEIPVLYLGNFFERPEIRDLLCVISLTAEIDGRALYRLANFDEYGFSFRDVKIFTDYAFENRIKFPRALRRFAKVKSLSPSSQAKFEKLAEHFKGFHFRKSAWHVLSQYLFIKSDYLRLLAADDSVQGQQKRLAVYQLLLLTYQLREQFSDSDGNPKYHFLNYVRHLKLNNEEKQLRQPPQWADEINAVRLMTVHAAKGLEWSAVHLPTLCEGKFPQRSPRPEKCPPPPEMLPDETDQSYGDDETSSFFVALSRARNHLFLYRAREYEFSQKESSRFLKLIEAVLPPAICKPPERVAPQPRQPKQIEVVIIKRQYTERQLSVYLECPLAYYYRFVLEIYSSRSETPIGKTHLCVYRVGEAIRKEQIIKGKVTTEFVERQIVEIWAKSGPVKHPYEPDYQSEARQMIRLISERNPSSEDRIIQPEWTIELENGLVMVRPDYIEFFDDGEKMKVTVERLNFGATPEKIQDDIYVLFDEAARQSYPEFNREVRATYMTDGGTVILNPDYNQRRNALQNYKKAIRGILAEDFSPRANTRKCPLCPYYNICPSKAVV